MQTEPLTLVDVIRHFADPDVALQTMIELRWPNGVCCPTCGGTEVRFIPTRRLWECKEKHAKRQFSAKVGTIFEDSPIGLHKWLVALWMVANRKNGVSSYDVHRTLGITQKSAWFMLHRIRLAMQVGSLMKAEGTLEADETFIDGLTKKMHKERRKRTIKGAGKGFVMGISERSGRSETSWVWARVIANCLGVTLQEQVRAVVEPGANVYTGAHAGYVALNADYQHAIVDHAVDYVNGQVHTNSLESFWRLLKRGLKGTYVSVQPFHLIRYLDEQIFRLNERTTTDHGRCKGLLAAIVGKRLTYKELTGYDIAAAAV